MTGNLLLTFTDLVLPGNAGFDLKIQRTYNSKIFPNYDDGDGSIKAPSEDTWAGVGWTFHLGRIPEPTVAFDVPPPIEMPDGSRHPLYHHIAPNSALCPPNGTACYVTRDFWVYNKNNFILKLPNGVEYTFGKIVNLPSGQQYRYVTSITDPFGNQLTVQYMTGSLPPDGIASITQTMGSSNRTVSFVATTDSLRRLQTMTFNGRTWTYNQSPAVGGYSLLTGVTPPTGPGWTFNYNMTTAPLYELTKVTSPFGGTITYTYGDQDFRIGSNNVVTNRVIKSRTTGGTFIQAGNWTYAYAQPPAPSGAQNQSVITGPCNKTTYTFSGIGNFTAVGPTWRVGLPTQRKLEEGATTLETEDIVWQASALISNDFEQIGNNSSSGINVALLDTRTITQGPRTYVTDYNYGSGSFNDYGRPQTITETGELVRTSTRTYTYGFSPRYIVDKLGSETVTVAGESFVKNYNYNLSNGFTTSETIYGISKTYVATTDGLGNVASATDANGHAHSYQYTWGQVSRIQTPLYNPLLTRVINIDGTIASETRRGFTTSFGYDALSRPTSTAPPVGNATNTTYDLLDASGRRFNRVARGSSVTETLLDGFGRRSATRNSVGINTDQRYDACGHLAYESLPYTTTSTGTSFTYDGLDRLKQKTNPDATNALYVYSNGIDVTITNERQKTTVQDWSAFGDPREARLVGVTDGDSKVWAYAYNALGGLTQVIPPTGSARTWVYYGTEAGGKPGLLKSETHPEAGTVSYTYDPAGLLLTRTDPTFGQTAFTYDPDDRLILANRPGTASDTTFSWDASDNRTLLQNGYVSSSFGYDAANRLTSRTDTVNARTFTTTLTPDGNGNLQQIDYPAPSGLSVRYSYDSENRITDVRKTGAATAWANAFGYHPSGAPTSFAAGNGLVHSFTYTNRHWVDTINSGALSLNYDYNNGVGNIDSITDARPGMSQSFTYDNLDRLSTTTGIGAGSLAYDAAGNRSSKTISGSGSTSYSYNGLSQLASSTGAEPDSFTYDLNGNLKTSAGYSFSYTPENLLETVAGTTYRYDGDNLRTLKVDPTGVNHYYLHGPGSQILSEFADPCAGQPPLSVRDNVYLGTRLLLAVRPSTAPAMVSFTASASSASEGAGSSATSVRVTTSAGGPTVCPVSVMYTTGDGTAVGSADYAPASGMLTFPASSASGTILPISVPITQDTLDENDETFTVSLSDIAGALLLPPSLHTVTILDDDPPPSLSINDVAINEGNGGTTNAVFSVSLSAPSGKTITVGYATANGTATSGADYTAVSGTLTFTAGTLTQPVTVPIIGDLTDEVDETYFVNLSGATNATIADSQGLGTIFDDDATPTISSANCAAIEGDSGTSPCAFRVSLSVASGKTVTVDYATADGTAIAGSDYLAASGTLTFSPGVVTQDANVSIIGDGVSEPNRTFILNLSNPTNATISNESPGRGTITDNDLMKLFTLSPCRLADTANPIGPSGGPALVANAIRTFPAAGLCGIPSTAKAIAAVVTTVEQADFGDLRVYHADGALPSSSTINFAANHARANNAIIALGTDGKIAVMCDLAVPTGTVRFILDVFGYFE